MTVIQSRTMIFAGNIGRIEETINTKLLSQNLKVVNLHYIRPIQRRGYRRE